MRILKDVKIIERFNELPCRGTMATTSSEKRTGNNPTLRVSCVVPGDLIGRYLEYRNLIGSFFFEKGQKDKDTWSVDEAILARADIKLGTLPIESAVTVHSSIYS